MINEVQRIYFNGNWRGYIEVDYQIGNQNNVDGTTPVHLDYKIGQDSGYSINFPNTNGAYIGMLLGGIHKYLYFDALELNGNSRLLGSLDFTLTHDENGNTDPTLSFWSGNTESIVAEGLSWGSLSHSITLPIPVIIRSGIIESVSDNLYLGNPVTLKIKDNESGLTHQVWYKAFDSDWIEVGNGLGTTVTFTPKRELYKNADSSDTGTLSVCVRTYKKGKAYGKDVYKENIPIKIPEDIKPKIQDVVFKDNYAKRKQINVPIFLQHVSDIDYEVQISSDSLSEPVEFITEIENGNKTFYGKKGNIGSFNKKGEYTIKTFAKDKRGRVSNTITKTIQVVPYTAPQLSFVVRRSGARNETLTVTRTAKIEPLIYQSKQWNTFSLKFYTKRIEDDEYIENQGGKLISNSIYQLLEHSSNLAGVFNAEQSYIVKAVLSDLFNETEYIFSVSTEKVPLSYSPEGVGINKIWERGAADIGGDVYVGGFLAIKGNRHSLPFSGDANTLSRAGSYFATNLKNAPATTGYLTVSSHSDNDQYIVQAFIPFNSTVLHLRKRERNEWSIWTNVWMNVTYRNGWKDYSTSYPPVQYKLTNSGAIELRGSCKGGDSSNWQAVFSFHSSIKVPKQVYLTALTGDYQRGILAVYGNGTEVVTVQNINNGWLCFDGVTITN